MISKDASSCPLLSQAARTALRHQMIAQGDRILVGVSGGPDSVALLHLLLLLKPRFSLAIGVVHLNHTLRQAESDRDADFVAALTRKQDLPYYACRADVRKYRQDHRLSLEEAARRVRYAFFSRIAAEKGYGAIALGHNSDDNAELVLMHLLRGSGPLGLSGIPAVRRLSGSRLKIVRPLIESTRADIMAFLQARRIPWVLDSTNADPRFIRNRIRLELLPFIKRSFNPAVAQNLNRLADLIRDEDQYLEQVIAPFFDRAVTARASGRLTLSVPVLNQLHPAARRRVLRMAIRECRGTLRRITFPHINAVIRLMESRSPEKSLDLPDRIRIRRSHEALHIRRENRPLREIPSLTGGRPASAAPGYRLTPPQTVRLETTGAVLKVIPLPSGPPPDFQDAGHNTAFFDMDKLQFPLIARLPRPGDRFTPLGMSGRQKLTRFFSNRKIPRAERDTCPVLVSGDKIIWVAGHRIDDSVKVTPATVNVLKAELLLA